MTEAKKHEDFANLSKQLIDHYAKNPSEPKENQHLTNLSKKLIDHYVKNPTEPKVDPHYLNLADQLISAKMDAKPKRSILDNSIKYLKTIGQYPIDIAVFAGVVDPYPSMIMWRYGVKEIFASHEQMANCYKGNEIMIRFDETGRNVPENKDIRIEGKRASIKFQYSSKNENPSAKVWNDGTCDLDFNEDNLIKFVQISFRFTFSDDDDDEA